MTEEWILDLNKELQLPQNSPAQELGSKSIYRLPEILTDFNSQAYEPILASFGPYHHNCRHLLPMEQHKRRALVQFLRRIAKASKTLDDVLIAMSRVEPDLMASYDVLQIEQDDKDFIDRCHSRRRLRPCDMRKRDEFLKVMIVDGCFALEIMLAAVHHDPREYDHHDPVFGDVRRPYVVPFLKRDMLLVENQLPLLALTTLAAINGSGIRDVNTLINDFYGLGEGRKIDKCFHILDLYRKILTSEGEYLPFHEDTILSATELRNVGVSFCKSKTKSFRDISFNRGILSLPQLLIDDTTESLLVNLMAFESLHAPAGDEVTAYVYFMDGLINTADDIALLRTKEIIKGSMSCDEYISNLFNNINKAMILKPSYKEDASVDSVQSKLNTYCKKRMHRWRANFVETYLKNPWVFFSLIGGLFLLALTIIQSVYTMMQYYNA